MIAKIETRGTQIVVLRWRLTGNHFATCNREARVFKLASRQSGIQDVRWTAWTTSRAI
jgi:hypothetical protein